MHAAEQFQPFTFPNDFGNLSHHSFSTPPTLPVDCSSGFDRDQQLQQQRHHHHHLLPSPRHQPRGSTSTNGAMTADQGVATPEDGPSARTGSDDDENLTPAQSRRKAQNRAAQRAFRERKERHVKDLEAKLANLQAAQQKTEVENERLKRNLQKVSTENEMLRATSSMGMGVQGTHAPEPPTDTSFKVVQNDESKQLPIDPSDDVDRLLPLGATWDFIITHDLFKRGLVDIGQVTERLASCARCNGQGPAFTERDILRAMELSVGSGSDDLLS
ncbi:hypothetical protein RJ55_06082 [Drechmeria coniospora]|nr:hypothetical protein RJ55_06082 [Drechmeria coniospora]